MNEPPEPFVFNDDTTLDFSIFHATGDHWPFTAYCRTMYGGGRTHLKYAWEFHRRDQLLTPWHWFRCTVLKRHAMRSGWRRPTLEDVMEPYTACLDCGKPA
jgi:hypothetical protein